jgi:hypothetical protein
MTEQMVVIPARMLAMDGTRIDQSGLADVQVNRAVNVGRGLPPLKVDRTPKGPVAIVGYGPSLKETWPRLLDFPTIYTVSRAHDFLLERGITPTAHIDLDPRAHKATFMETPVPGVRYILSTHIHPTYLDKLATAGVTPELFHVAIDQNEALDPRYQAMGKNFKRPGVVRYDAGVQAAEAAFQNGHREQHWFGIEYGRAGEQTHADRHWGTTSAPCVVDVDGRQFGSTQLFFHGLLLAEQFLCERGAVVRCTIHGDGLLGHFLKCRGRTRFTLKV